MKKHALPLIAFITAVFLLFTSCSPDPDRKLHDAIEDYAAGKQGAEEVLSDAFIRSVSIDSIKGSGLQSNGTLVYRLDENEAEIVYPLNRTVSLPGGEGIRQIAISDRYIVLHDGMKFDIFDQSGDLEQEETLGDMKNPLRSVAISGEEIIYYQNSLLYRYHIIDRTTDTFSKETFPPPYTSYYTAQLYQINDLLFILAGIAGSYNFNIVNGSTGSVVLKNLKMSSYKHHAGPDEIFYIAGNSGDWELMRYSFGSKIKKSIKKFSDIKDIELTSSGCVWESGTGLWVYEYGKESVRVPFSYLLAGKYKGRVLLQAGDRYYFINMKKLSAALAILKEKTPGLFTVK